VPSKLDYSSGHIIRYLDAVLQKESTNQRANADIVVDGVTIATNIPATFLLGLESRLKYIKGMYVSIPTLQPGIKWEIDLSQSTEVFKRVYPEERFRTKKVRRNHEIAPATDKHPAQVEVYDENINVGKIVTDTWCGMITTAQKSAILGRVDKLIRAVKKARQQANATEVVDITIGKVLVDYING